MPGTFCPEGMETHFSSGGSINSRNRICQSLIVRDLFRIFDAEFLNMNGF